MSKVFPLAIALAVAPATIGGMSWYTGTQVEPMLREKLVEASRQFNTALVGQPLAVKLELRGIDRRWFSSTAYVVTTLQGTGSVRAQPVGMEAVIEIEHGPFPWSRVKAFQLMPVMISANLSVQSNAHLAQALNVPENSVFLTGGSTVFYRGAQEGRFKLSSARWKGAETTWGFPE